MLQTAHQDQKSTRALTLSLRLSGSDLPRQGYRDEVQGHGWLEGGTKGLLREALREHGWLILLVICYVTAGYLAEWWSGKTGMMDVQLYSPVLMTVTPCFLVGFMTIHAVWWMLHLQPGRSLLASWWQDLRSNYLTCGRVSRFLIVFFMLTPFMNTFGSFKRAIPVFAPIGWDTTFMEMDRLLHSGQHPWEWLQPWVGHPLITFFISFCYQFWILLLFTVVIWQAWSQNRLLRMQFLLTFVLMWSLLGTGMAMLLSSAGPCYYARVTGLDSPYQSLMTYLYGVNDQLPIFALRVQEMLWASYRSGELCLVSGISAMPSMHVASSVLFALVGWRTNHWLGMALTLFAVIIQIGSVHLAWHYAIDGYVSATLTVTLWIAVGWVLRRYHPSFTGVTA